MQFFRRHISKSCILIGYSLVNTLCEELIFTAGNGSTGTHIIHTHLPHSNPCCLAIGERVHTQSRWHTDISHTLHPLYSIHTPDKPHRHCCWFEVLLLVCFVLCGCVWEVVGLPRCAGKTKRSSGACL